MLKRVSGTQFNFIDISEQEEEAAQPPEAAEAPVGQLPPEMHYLTPRVILMSFPTAQLREKQARYLNSRYPRRYMI